MLMLRKDRNKFGATRETHSQAAWKKGWNEVADYIKSLKVFNGIKYYTFWRELQEKASG